MPRIASQVTPKIHLTITQPTTTLLHRAGMAGLWMTLKQLENLGVKVFPGVKETVQNLKKVIAKDLMLSRKRS
ncbi:hypothetical protein H6G76_28525 [Nostoc sp. FACHB-152]|uniref:hypothetical protein n=1 Tax=unclassified Nostoc TaxID=2593658 RepID=UPI0016875E01|nr:MULTISPECIES: hypothetical protein [unclassified Nostoc]MBD2451004.1 hypothetical protein [Nostoc sp. FACHB-152]MBD2471053.1 hypothetical protein [Nostoc sp. FACHB-145]